MAKFRESKRKVRAQPIQRMVWYETEQMIKATKVALEKLYKPSPMISLFPELDELIDESGDNMDI
eukprot:CAMPEP_0170195484 /NCGR_PEP_ID=MMETSP0040_2-20121228/61604_1 /TAXON_ID=641309 /ORGANISM="Lotharella oceanica, Strain CCMP622" /LENGTH=64 /DNA_ID=CAMNT_0010444659 /DNA_START=37 /DNA_END=231 /DNA_ORIENTATION=+